jgi:Helix-turn-helix domain
MNENNQGAAQVGGVEGAIGRSRFLSSAGAADYLGITLRELKGLRARKALPFYRIGHRTVTYSPRDLDAFLEKCRVAAAA